MFAVRFHGRGGQRVETAVEASPYEISGAGAPEISYIS